jgi:hypothetical protein
VRRVVELKRSGGTKVIRGSRAAVKTKTADKPSAAPPPPNGTPAVEGREPGMPAISGRNATRVVRQAAKVLEQELAAGIVAAKRIEERFIDVQQIRSRNPDEVMQRFRRDAHEVVDIIVDVLTVVVDQANNVTERSFAIGGSRKAQARANGAPNGAPNGASNGAAAHAQSVPTLATPVPMVPGQTVEIMISVENDSDKPTLPIVFKSSDLASSEQAVIPASNVKCAPSEIVLGPRSVERVAVRIHVPQDTPPGTYCGMFQANNLATVRAVLVVEVRAAE